MPQVRNSYGDRAMDQEFDLLIKRVKALETQIGQPIVQASAPAAAAVPAAVALSFVSIAKWDVD